MSDTHNRASIEDLERMRRFGNYEERERIVKLIESIYNDETVEEYGSMVWTSDIIELIKKGSD
jgi:hypothetical protein